MSVSLYRLSESVHKEIVDRLDQVGPPEQAVDFAWLTYALRFLEKADGSHFKEALGRLENWASSGDAGARDRDLGPLCLCYHLSATTIITSKLKATIRRIVRRALADGGTTKFSVLNDPGQAWCVGVARDALGTTQKREVCKVFVTNAKGRPSRKVLFEAARMELGERGNPVCADPGTDPDDVISALWAAERYRIGDVRILWEKLGQTSLPSQERDLSARSLTLLADAIAVEVQHPDPNILFDLFPFEKEIVGIARDHFMRRKYASAVFEATKKLNEFIQKVSASSRSEAELAQSTMRQRGNKAPLIRFNDYLDEDSGKNDQIGVAMIAEGVFKAFRNPKGHKPEDHPLIELNAYEALEQLATVDYVWKRVRNAKVVKDAR